MTEAQYEAEQINKELVGWKIVGSFVDEDEEFFGFIIKKNGITRKVWVDRDPEGNGPGHLNIKGA